MAASPAGLHSASEGCSVRSRPAADALPQVGERWGGGADAPRLDDCRGIRRRIERHARVEALMVLAAAVVAMRALYGATWLLHWWDNRRR